MSALRRSLVAGLVVLAVVAALLSFNLFLLGRRWSRVGPLVAGSAAPDFVLPAATGPRLRLSEQRARLVLLDFWAAWCGPCMRAMPALGALQRDLGPLGLQIVSINVDGDTESARAATRTLGPAVPVLVDQGEVSNRYGVHVLPYLVLVGRDGRIVDVRSGPLREDKLREQLRRLLGAPAAAR